MGAKYHSKKGVFLWLVPLSSHTGCSIPFDLRILRILLPAAKISFSNFLWCLCLLRTGNYLNLRDTVRISQRGTDLRGRGSLSGELAYLLDDLVGCGLEP